jgi:GTP:adenosylcobinamide-phosphate guanylyltransferase
MYAVITAGGMLPPDLAREAGTATKALAPLGTRRLIDPAIDAARNSGTVAIAVIGSSAVTAYCASRVEKCIDAEADGAQNIRLALRAFPAAERLIFLTSDLPFIDAGALRAFVAASEPFALTMALAPADAYAAEYPGAPQHSVRLGRDTVANGSAFVIDRRAVDAVERIAGKFFAARKSLPRLAVLLGPALSLRFISGTLRIDDIERRAARVLGVPVRAIRNAAPGLCFDVDDLADWTYAHSLALASE